MNGVRWYTPSEVRWCTPSEASNTLRARRVTRFERGERHPSSGASDILRARRAIRSERGEQHASSGASNSLRARRVTRFEQGEQFAPSEASNTLRARRTVKLGFTVTIRFAVRFKFSLQENLLKNIEGCDISPSAKECYRYLSERTVRSKQC